MASLQERLRLAESTPEKCRQLEKEVDRHETVAGELRARLKELEQARGDQQAENASLGDRIRQTEQLIEELKRSPEGELLRTVEAVWRAVGDHHSHRT
jgi:predicted  nucleic acid-binding Zn-ribbon protein